MLAGGLNTTGGQVTNEPVARAHGLENLSLADAIG